MKLIRRARSDLHKKVAEIASVANIPEIQAQSELINKILNTDYVDNAGINEFEEIREKLRDLMKYIPRGKIKYETNFSDELLSATWKESELENDELKNYKAKAEYYIRHTANIRKGGMIMLRVGMLTSGGDCQALTVSCRWRWSYQIRKSDRQTLRRYYPVTTLPVPISPLPMASISCGKSSKC